MTKSAVIHVPDVRGDRLARESEYEREGRIYTFRAAGK